MSSTAPHKLAPRSSLYIFLGYSSEHKGYRCLELQSNRIIISRHLVFDESFFPFSDMSTTPMAPSALDFLTDEHDLTTSVPGAHFVHAGTAPSTPTTVHGTVPIHGTVAAPELTPWLPDLGAAAPVHPAQAAASSASSTLMPVQHGAAAPVPPLQAAASGTASTAPSSTAGTAAPAARAQVAASGTGHTTATRPIAITPVTNAPSMRTRSKAGIAQPVDRLNLHAVPMSPLPRSVRDALSDPN
jgi:hypothetical protein